MFGLFHLARDRAAWDAAHWAIELPHWPVFYDLHILLAGLRVHETGTDPLALAPESVGTLYNYPRAWLWFAALGPQYLPAPVLGLVLGLGWILALVLSADVRGPGLAVALSLALLSPPVLLALERGNSDLVVALLALLAALASTRFAHAAPFLITAAGILKLFPVSALALGLLSAPGKNRFRLLPWCVGAAVFAVYWAVHFPDLLRISTKTPRVTGASFGSNVVPMRYAPHLDAWFDITLGPAAVLALATLLCSVWLALAACLGWRLGATFAPLLAARRAVALFAVSALLFVSAFALGNNFAYRFIVVLPALPLLWHAVTSNHLALAVWQWAAVSLAALAISLFAPLNATGRTFVFAQLAHWFLVATLAVGVVALFRAHRDQAIRPAAAAI